MASIGNLQASSRSEQQQHKAKSSIENDMKRMLGVEFEDFKKNPNKCCFKFPVFYTELYRLHIQELAVQYQFKFQIKFSSDGNKYVQIFKSDCPTYCSDDTTFKLTETSQKEIFKYLSNYPLEPRESLELLPGYAKNENLSKPRVQVYKFSIGGSQNIYPSVPPSVKNLKYAKRRTRMPIYDYRDILLNSINRHQITLVCGHSSIGKSTQLPQYILENATKNNEHCRIILAHLNQISAVNNSRVVANERCELLGLAIGYQIRLKSVSSFNTNMLYTTIDFFLRCLMGINSKDVFHDVTHVILADCQERDHNTDLLLLEIKEILSFYPNLKIILMTNSKNFDCYRDFFKNISVIQIHREYHTVITKDLTEILELLNYNSLNHLANSSQQHLNKNRQELINNIIEKYFDTGDDITFNEFLYINEIEGISINIQHSENGCTMLMAAVKNNNLDHLDKLLNRNADINIIDSNNRTALDWANLNCSARSACVAILQTHQKCNKFKKYCNENDQNNIELYKAYKAKRIHNYMEIDYALLSNLVQYINEKLDVGTILIFLPKYSDIVKMEFYLNIYKKSLNLSKTNAMQLKVFKLHDMMRKHELDEIIESDSTLILRKCILTTQVAESCININDAVYVIDTGRMEGSNSKLNLNDNTKISQWISKEQSEARKLIAGRCKSGYCYRFYTTLEAIDFNCFIWPKILLLPLDKICLCAKLLSPYTTVSEYFNRLICTPKKSLIEESVKLLKLIGAFDEQENVTILGIRLVDIPLDVQLGKVLIYSILLQCLDPVLTIVSILAYKDPLELSQNSSETEKIENLNYRRNLIKMDSLNDLLVLLRLFQHWQDERGAINTDDITLDKFLLDANLLQICELRTQIVGIVRAAQLIHSQGILSMHYVNLKANKWSLVKACFVAGLYPQICRVRDGIKSKDHNLCEIRLNPCSVLNNNTTLNFKYKKTDYESEWLIYKDCMNLSEGFQIIKHCIPVHPLTICLFSGHLKKSSDDIRPLAPITKKEEKEFNVQVVKCEDNKDENTRNTSSSYYVVDDWINFILNTDDSIFIFNLRQKFSSFFNEILESCDNSERMRRFRGQHVERLCILDTISRVLINEDRAWNFSKPERVGERPRALPLSSMHDIHSVVPDVEFDVPPLPEPEVLSGPSGLTNESNYYMPSLLLNASLNAQQYSGKVLNEITNPSDYSLRSNNTELNTSKCDRDYNYSMHFPIFPWSQVPINKYLALNSQDIHQSYNSSIKNNTPLYWNENIPTGYCQNYQQEQQVALSSQLYIPPMMRSHQKLNMNTLQKRPNQQPLSGNKLMNRKFQQNIEKYFILPCKNLADAIKYFKENIWNDGTTLWDKMCIQYMKTVEESNFYVFLYNEEHKIFYGYGQIQKHDVTECRLTEFVPGNLEINTLKLMLVNDKYDVDVFSNSLHYGEINTDSGLILLSYMK